MKFSYKTINILIPFFILILSTGSVVANDCKASIKALERAKDAETKACNAASKAFKDKTIDEYKNADRRCKEKRKAPKLLTRKW
ncbi:hypothetical protein [Marinicella sp. W31]|uniref:hypothetical protein n=1 Tax=Marinicella sp. W31 TaxID=3023713 RepID=UPI0037567826